MIIFEIDREVPEAAVKAGQTVSIEASTVEIEERGVKERSFSFFRFFLFDQFQLLALNQVENEMR